MLLNLIYLTIINCVAGGWIDPDTSYSFYRTDPLTHSDNQDYYLVSKKYMIPRFCYLCLLSKYRNSKIFLKIVSYVAFFSHKLGFLR